MGAAKQTPNSPWGPIDYVDRVRSGVRFVHTASHGGFCVGPALNALIPLEVQKACFPGTDMGGARGGWYEEDCDACFPPIFVPGIATDERRRQALCFALSYLSTDREPCRHKGAALETVELETLRELARFDDTAGVLPPGVDALRSALAAAGS